jgi:glycosyltransferase involved in cell wall biosynthesis
VYEAATFVVAKSAWCEGSLRHVYGVPDGKLRRIPFGVPVPGAVRCEASTGLPQVTFIGTTLARKGGERLLRVYGSRLHGRCELNMVTRDVVAPQPGVRVFADFEPGDPRLTELLRRTAVLAFPTEMDSFGYAALEAMAMGVPVVGTRLHALPEIVDDGVTGLLVEPDDGQLAGALELLLADEPLRHAMGDAARSRVQSRFDARITTGAVVDLAFEAYDRFRFGAAAGARA